MATCKESLINISDFYWIKIYKKRDKFIKIQHFYSI